MSGLHQVIKTTHIKHVEDGVGGVQLPANCWQKLWLLIKKESRMCLPYRKISLNKDLWHLNFSYHLCTVINSKSARRTALTCLKKEEKWGKGCKKEVFPLEHILCGKIPLRVTSGTNIVWQCWQVLFFVEMLPCHSSTHFLLLKPSALNSLGLGKKNLQRMCKVGEL